MRMYPTTGVTNRAAAARFGYKLLLAIAVNLSGGKRGGVVEAEGLAMEGLRSTRVHIISSERYRLRLNNSSIILGNTLGLW